MTQVLSASAAIVIRRPMPVVFPPRSHLYPLAPHVPESLWCESLTSYLNRLARAHHVSPRSLVAEVINPLLPSPDPFVAAFGAQVAMGLNGNGELSKDWQTILGCLTGQINLHRCTLETFLGDFPSPKILRRTPVWCPMCLEEWKRTGQLLYQPLLWMLQVVVVCPTHQTLLVDCCPACHHRQKVLATNKTQPFECTSCAAWLGKEASPRLEGEEAVHLLAWQTWLFSALKELHQVSLNLGGFSWQTFFTQLVDHLKERRGAFRRLALATGTEPANFHARITHQQIALPGLLTFCYRCEVTPWQVMQGQLEPLERIIRDGSSNVSPVPPRSHRLVDRDVCAKHLDAALSREGVLPSLREVAKELGYEGTNQLMYHFPEKCALIAQRHLEYRNQRKQQRLLKVRDDVRQAVFSLSARGEYPLRYKLSDEFFPNGLMRQTEAIEAWREAMQELGLDPDNQHKAHMRLTQNSD
jgi:hypothetical protein